MREGKPLPNQTQAPAAVAAAAAPTSGSSSAATARLRFQSKKGVFVKAFPSETTLFEVAQQIQDDVGWPIKSFTTTFPRKTYEAVDFGQTLAEAGLVPSAVLVVN
jgi:peptide methionine sulfoxide reductase MsrB